MSFSCQFCGKVFKYKSNLKYHEKYCCPLNPNKQTAKRYTQHHKVACSICGKLIDVANIKRHESVCKNVEKSSAYHVSHEGLTCAFCGKQCKNKNSLTQHELRCKQNPNRKNFNSFDEFNAKQADLKATVGLNKHTCEWIAKSARTLKQQYQSGQRVSAMKGKPGTFLGRKHKESSKTKIRESTLTYIENTCGSLSVRYNVKACRYIEFLNNHFDLHLQHAENGGEFRVCGYFLDGYDSKHNIAFEYDEPHHYSDVNNNVLCDRDLLRMKTIIKELDCKFIRYNERLDLLYEVKSDVTSHIISL